MLKQGERWSENGRRGWVFTYPVEQEARFDAVMEEAKKRKEWAKLWGRFAFTIKMVMPPRREEPLEDTVRCPGYQAIMRKVGSAQLCMGCCIIGGLSNINKKFRLRMYDSDGNLEEIIKRSIRELMEGMKFNGTEIWINITDVGGGMVAGFFSNVVPAIKNFIKA